MSKLTELLDDLCPDGVEFKRLGEVAGYVKDKRESAGLDRIDFVGVDSLLPNYGGLGPSSYGPNAVKVTAFDAGDVLIGNIRPYLKKIWMSDRSGGCSGDVLALRIFPEMAQALDSRFLYRVLASEKFFDHNMQHARGGKMPRGDKEMILQFLIPVPPLEVQQEIVRVLDAFTSLERNLVSELELRKKQFAAARREIVMTSQSLGSESLTLGEAEARGTVALGRGKVISKKALLENPGDYPVYSSSGSGNGEFGRYGLYMFDDERISWSVDGGGKLFFRPAHRYSVTNVSGWMTVNSEELSAKYLYYVLFVQWENERFDYTRKAHPSVIRDVYKFFIPELCIQEDVVIQLDAFESLIQSIEQEIALRRKQYEHYRDELLSFTPSLNKGA